MADDLNFSFRQYDPFGAYGQSKTANVLFAVEATRRWAGDGITANALMPGGIATALAADEQFRAGLTEAGWEVRALVVPPVDETLSEAARIFELDRRLADHVAAAAARDAFALVLGGNCISCLGTTAGIRGDEDLGVVWFDAHADFDTPDDNLSGFADVMSLAILTGNCWRACARRFRALLSLKNHLSCWRARATWRPTSASGSSTRGSGSCRGRSRWRNSRTHWTRSGGAWRGLTCTSSAPARRRRHGLIGFALYSIAGRPLREDLTRARTPPHIRARGRAM
jgi:hypothetical protein